MRTYNVYDTLDMLYMRMYNIYEKLIYTSSKEQRTLPWGRNSYS